MRVKVLHKFGIIIVMILYYLVVFVVFVFVAYWRKMVMVAPSWASTRLHNHVRACGCRTEM